LLAGREEAKSHSSSASAFAACRAGCGDELEPPTKSSNDEEAGVGWLCAGGGWKGLDPARGLAETSDANGSAGGGVAVD
jgi:hypothetical protein